MPTGIANFVFSAQDAGAITPHSTINTQHNHNIQRRENSFRSGFSGLRGLNTLPLIQKLLQQLVTGNNNNSTPASVTLNPAQQSILDGLHAVDRRGDNIAGRSVSVLDSNSDQSLSAGDTLLIKDRNGNEISRSTLDTQDLYDLRFRENMLKLVEPLGKGWDFSDELVAIQGGKLQQPEVRPYQDGGASGMETVKERNDYWEVVQRGNNRYLLMRQTDDQGNPVKPSDAINDIFRNREDYAFDCATPMRLLNLKATLDTIGAEDFDKNAGRLLISSWHDQHDDSRFDGGYIAKVRTADAGEIEINGIRNLQGETAMFDPSKGDSLQPGSAYYFDLPGDQQSAVQGWNAIYTGRTESGAYRFWSSNIGMVDVTFDEGTWIPNDVFDGYYLGAVTTAPDTGRLQSWDNNPSV